MSAPNRTRLSTLVRVPLRVAGLLAALAAGAGAQVTLSGNVSDGAGGPLLSGQVYHVTGVVTVPASTTLTVQPGAIVKFGSATRLSVSGNLQVQGTAGNRAVFTALADDTAGGDTNGDGASTGAPGAWQGLQFNATSAGSVVDHAEVRFAGQSFFAAVGVLTNPGSFTLRDSLVRDCASDGIELNNVPGSFSLQRNEIRACAGYALTEVHIDVVPGLLDNVASGNALGDVVHVTSGAISADRYVGPRNGIDSTVYLATIVTVPAGLTLTLDAGTILKLGSATRLAVSGDLVSNGSALEPVILTAIADDSVGGDALNDGATTGVPGAWQGVALAGTSTASLLEHTTLRYFGQSFYAGIDSTAPSFTLRDSLLELGAFDGIELSNVAGSYALERNEIRDCGSYAIDEVHVNVLSGLLDNVASGNGSGDVVRVTSGALVDDLVVGPRNGIDGTIFANTIVTVPDGLTLELLAGSIWKLASGTRFAVSGDLIVSGTSARRVVVTAIADDEYGGDSLGDGPTVGSPGAYQGIALASTSTASRIEFLTARYFGQSFYSGIDSTAPSFTLRDSILEHGSFDALDLSNQAGDYTIEKNTFRDCAGVAVQAVHVDTLGGFRRNQAYGNQGGDYQRVTIGTLSNELVLARENLLGGVLTPATILTVGTGASLTIREGVVVKWLSAGTRLTGPGTVLVEGTGEAPVVFTAFADDEHGGDTNGDGPSDGAPGAWQGLDLQSAERVVVEHALIRYAGASFFRGLRVDGDTLGGRDAEVRSTRVEHGAWDGFEVSSPTATPTNLVAFQNAGVGIRLDGGLDLVHATAVGNVGAGIERSAGSARAVNSIAWGNGSNFLGFGGGDLVHCNGDSTAAGSGGNLFTDPLFVDEVGGDLTLTASSPCLDAADVPAALAVELDIDERSRLLDDALSGALLPDMGAYERGLWTATVEGPGVLGGRLRHTVQGPAGTSAHYLGLLDGRAVVGSFGFLATGTASNVLLGLRAVGESLVLDVPRDPALEGLALGLQTLTSPDGAPTVGQATRLVRLRLRAVEACAPRPSSL